MMEEVGCNNHCFFVENIWKISTACLFKQVAIGLLEVTKKISNK